MSINYLAMLASLKVGVDFPPDTDPDTVPHVRQPGVIPTYSVEIERDGNWVPHIPAVLMSDLPDVVEAMHWDYTSPVRLLENGYPVFTCETV